VKTRLIFFDLRHDKNYEAQPSCNDLRNNDHPFSRVENQPEQGKRDPNESHDQPKNLIELLAPGAVIFHRLNSPFFARLFKKIPIFLIIPATAEFFSVSDPSFNPGWDGLASININI
jgi:hypothetical protein